MDLKDIVWEVVYWIHLAEYRGPVTGFCEFGKELSGFRKMLGSSSLAEEILGTQKGLLSM
jgi:hypothetical protein